MSEERKPNILDDKKYSLTAPRIDGAKMPPKLSFSVYKGNPAVVAYTNVPGEDTKPIRCAFSGPGMGMLFALMDKVIAHQGACQFQVPLMKGKPSELRTNSTLVVGKDDDGVIYMAPKADGRRPVKFRMLPDLYHQLVKQDGTEFTKAEYSELYAPGYLRAIEPILFKQCDATYEKQTFQGGGNKGGWNKGNNGGGYNNNNSGGNFGGSKDFDNDFPM